MSSDLLTKLVAEATDDVIDEGCLHYVADAKVLKFAEQHRDDAGSETFTDAYFDTPDMLLAQHSCSLTRRVYLETNYKDTWQFKTAETIGQWHKMPDERQYGDVCPHIILIASTRRIPVTSDAWIDIVSNHYRQRTFYATVTARNLDAMRRAWAILGTQPSAPCRTPTQALLAHLNPDVSVLMCGNRHHAIIVAESAPSLVTDEHPRVEYYEHLSGFMEISRRRLELGMLDE